jgi:hypothetical protein
MSIVNWSLTKRELVIIEAGLLILALVAKGEKARAIEKLREEIKVFMYQPDEPEPPIGHA